MNEHEGAAMTALPELPKSEIKRASWDDWRSQYHDESDPMPDEWEGEEPVEVQGFYSGDQMREYGRQCYAAGMELAAQIATGFATCGCNGAHGRCNEDDPPLAIAVAIREAAKG
jgi:hypothetical protein